MSYVIRHPGRVDLFDGGEGEWGPLSQAKRFDSEASASVEAEPGDVVITAPEKQPTHPINKHP